MSESNSTYNDQQKLSLVESIFEFPIFVGITISAVVSNSVLVWMDFVESLNSIVSSIFVFLLSRKLKTNLKYTYNYGVGKVEAISSLCCNTMTIFGLVCVFAAAIEEIINLDQPSDFLLYVLFLKVLNVVFDAYCIYKQAQIDKKVNTAVTKSELISCIKGELFDSVEFIAILITYVFRNNPASWLFSPIVSLIICVVFIVVCLNRIRRDVTELTDKTLPEQEQLLIMAAVLKYYNSYESLEAVNSHRIGNEIHIEFSMHFKEETSYAQIDKLRNELAEVLNETIPGSVVSIVIN